ncbi:LysM peptidoglycan-binding domain-containing protein [Paenibacillus tarimensis]
MLDQPSGLRFDVYERVHLPEDVAAIEELEEIELTPHIQVVHQGEQVLLRGNLLLSGVYSSQAGSEAGQSLEHWIPVEITLPMNRVHRLEDIAVEIENFDVDLLSSRTLNITGVLSLQGLQVQQQASANWQDEEPITVVHQIEERNQEAFHSSGQEEEAGEEPGSIAFQKPWYGEEPVGTQPFRQPFEAEPVETPTQQQFYEAEPAELPTQQQFYEAVPAEAPPHRQPTEGEAAGQTASFEPDEEEAASKAISWAAFTVPDEREQEVGKASLQESFGSSHFELEEQPSGQESSPFAAEPAFAPSREPAVQDPVSGFESNIESETGFAASPDSKLETEPAKQEMKIAFSGKRAEEEEEQPGETGIMTLLHSNRREQEARNEAKRQEEQQAAPEQGGARPSGDEVEWKKLFLNNQSEENEFRKLRMCIVQREETLEAIAERYRLNPREIVLYNRLADHNVTEGQVLSIPQPVTLKS